VESSILGALLCSALVAGLVVLLARAASGPIVLRQSTHHGRLRLPARAFERAAVIAIVAATAAVAPAFGGGDGTLVGAVVVGGAIVWCARRGVFLSPRSDGDDDAPSGGGG
jgi:hypothetical protein